MAMLKPKQIKLNAGQLVVGGATGNVLSTSTAGHVLTFDGSALTFTSPPAPALTTGEVFLGVGGVATATAPGVAGDVLRSTDGTTFTVGRLSADLVPYAAGAGGVPLTATNVSAALDQIATRMGAFTDVMRFRGTLATTDQDDNPVALPAEDANTSGDVYRIVGGPRTMPGGGTANSGDYIVWNGTGWNVIDSTNAQVTPGNGIAVGGNTDTGYTVSLVGLPAVTIGTVNQSLRVVDRGAGGGLGFDFFTPSFTLDGLDDVTVATPAAGQVLRYQAGAGETPAGWVNADLPNISELIGGTPDDGSVLTFTAGTGGAGGTWGAVALPAPPANGDFSLVGLSDTAGPAVDGGYLRWAGGTVVYQTSIPYSVIAAPVAAEDEHAAGVTGTGDQIIADFFTTPPIAGTVTVYINGLRVAAANVTHTDTDLTLRMGTGGTGIGYPLDTDDVVLARYEHAPAP